MEHCSKTIGDAYFKTPRNTVTAFVNLLAVLEQNPSAQWQSLLGGVALDPDANPDVDDDAGSDDELSTLRL
jgi:hypothetical protein